MDPQRLGQSIVDRDAVVTEFLPQRLLGLASSKWAGGAPERRNPCSECATTMANASCAAWDVEASASCTGHCDIMQPSSRIISTSGARLGANPKRPLDWPLPGAESQ
jgi:hypothetical protein